MNGPGGALCVSPQTSQRLSHVQSPLGRSPEALKNDAPDRLNLHEFSEYEFSVCNKYPDIASQNDTVLSIHT